MIRKNLLSTLLVAILILCSVPADAQSVTHIGSEYYPYLVLRYTFDDSAGAYAYDFSEYSGPAELLDGANFSEEGVYGGCLELDGKGGHVKLPDGILNTLEKMTISFWFNMDTANDWARVFDFGSYISGTNISYMFFSPCTPEGSARFAVSMTGRAEDEEIGDAPEINRTKTWHFCAITLSENVLKLYVNGKLVGINKSFPLKPEDLGFTNFNYIGKSQYPNDPYFDGKVDEFRIYSTALPEEAVKAFYDDGITSLFLQDADSLDIGNTVGLKKSLVLPTEGKNGSKIAWQSSDESVITGYGSITRPQPGEEPKKATLTATITNGENYRTKSFTVTVAPLEEGETFTEEYTAYLFTYFTEFTKGMHYAVSRDGLKWSGLNGGYPVIYPLIGNRFIRDPDVIRGEDGIFYMVATNSWESDSILVYKSSDLVKWDGGKVVKLFAGAANVWAPETVYDPSSDEYIVYYSARKTVDEPFKIYMSRTKNFEKFSGPELLFDPGYTAIDATINEFGGKYYMIFKDEREEGKNYKSLLFAVSDKPSGPYKEEKELLCPDLPHVIEGPTMFKALDSDRWYVLYDVYKEGKWGGVYTDNLSPSGTVWKLIPEGELSWPGGMRHGSVIPITEREYQNIVKEYPPVTSRIEGEKLSPIASYGFDEISGSTAKDSSANGFDITVLSGAAYSPQGRSGGCLIVDINKPGIRLPKSFPIYSPSFSISAWIKSDSYPPLENMRKGEWTNIVYTRSWNSGALYINGTKTAGTDIFALPLWGTQGQQAEGAAGDLPSVKVALDDLQFYNRALTVEEISLMASDKIPAVHASAELKSLRTPEGAEVSAGITVENPTKEDYEITFLYMVYSRRGRLTKLEVRPYTAKADSRDLFEASIALDKFAQNQTVKLYIWTKNGMRPIADALNIR